MRATRGCEHDKSWRKEDGEPVKAAGLSNSEVWDNHRLQHKASGACARGYGGEKGAVAEFRQRRCLTAQGDAPLLYEDPL